MTTEPPLLFHLCSGFQQMPQASARSLRQEVPTCAFSQGSYYYERRFLKGRTLFCTALLETT